MRTEWRLLTRGDLRELGDWRRRFEQVPCAAEALNGEPGGTHVNADREELSPCLEALERFFRPPRDDKPDPAGYEHGTLEKIPGPVQFRACRLTRDGAILAIVVFHASQAFDLCEVTALVAAEMPDLKPLETTRASLLLLLTDAVKSGGSLAIQFAPRSFPAGVPRCVRSLAAQVNVKLHNVTRGAIAPYEARMLYLRLTGFCEAAERIIIDRAERGFFSLEHLCYLVHRRVWSRLAVEFLLQGSPYADLLLSAGLQPEHGLLFDAALSHGRQAVLLERLHQALHTGDGNTESDVALTPPDREIEWSIDCVSIACNWIPRRESAHLIGWRQALSPPQSSSQDRLEIPADRRFVCLVRAQPLPAMRASLDQDLMSAQRLADEDTQTGVAVTAEFNQLPQAERERFLRLAGERSVILLRAPLTLPDLDDEVCDRLRQLARMRP